MIFRSMGGKDARAVSLFESTRKDKEVKSRGIEHVAPSSCMGGVDWRMQYLQGYTQTRGNGSDEWDCRDVHLGLTS